MKVSLVRNISRGMYSNREKLNKLKILDLSLLYPLASVSITITSDNSISIKWTVNFMLNKLSMIEFFTKDVYLFESVQHPISRTEKLKFLTESFKVIRECINNYIEDYGFVRALESALDKDSIVNEHFPKVEERLNKLT